MDLTLLALAFPQGTARHLRVERVPGNTWCVDFEVLIPMAEGPGATWQRRSLRDPAGRICFYDSEPAAVTALESAALAEAYAARWVVRDGTRWVCW